jgi:hypothetical protein
MARVRTVFVIGSGKCGSTLLDLLLDGHSQMFGVGEINGVRADSICTCGKRAQECRIWQDAFPEGGWGKRWEVFRTKLDFLLDRGPFRLVATREPLDEASFVAATLHAYRSVLAASGKSILVDSTGLPDRADLLMRSGELDPSFIFLVRDGRGVTWSYYRKYKRLFPFLFLWASMNLKNEWFLRRARRYGPVLFLRYEDLVREPERELRRVCDALGIPYEERMLALRENEHHQVEGNRMRFGKDPIRVDEAWRRDMPLSLRVAFDMLFGWLNLYYRLRGAHS